MDGAAIGEAGGLLGVASVLADAVRAPPGDADVWTLWAWLRVPMTPACPNLRRPGLSAFGLRRSRVGTERLLLLLMRRNSTLWAGRRNTD